MKFPRTIRHREAECKIYGKKPDYPFYRVAWYVTGQRWVKQFKLWGWICCQRRNPLIELPFVL